MSIERIVPDIESSNFERSIEFYSGFLGMELVMNQSWVMTFASCSNPALQITIIEAGCADYAQPEISIEVDDIHQAYFEAKKRGLPIEYPLTTEVWGVTRFFVRDPNGKLLNILSHSNAETLKGAAEARNEPSDCTHR